VGPVPALLHLTKRKLGKVSNRSASPHYRLELSARCARRLFEGGKHHEPKSHLPLLAELAKREADLQEGDSVLVQPSIDGMHVENPITSPGFDHDQIDAALRWLARQGYIDTGSLPIDAVLIGIFFSGISSAGRRMMSQTVT
jgi:hypothetical protein